MPPTGGLNNYLQRSILRDGRRSPSSMRWWVMVEEDKEKEVEWRKMMMECKCSAVQVRGADGSDRDHV